MLNQKITKLKETKVGSPEWVTLLKEVQELDYDESKDYTVAITRYSPIVFKSRRKEHGLNQKQMAIIMGMSEKSYGRIGKYENGDISAIENIRAWQNLNIYFDYMEVIK